MIFSDEEGDSFDGEEGEFDGESGSEDEESDDDETNEEQAKLALAAVKKMANAKIAVPTNSKGKVVQLPSESEEGSSSEDEVSSAYQCRNHRVEY